MVEKTTNLNKLLRFIYHVQLHDNRFRRTTTDLGIEEKKNFQIWVKQFEQTLSSLTSLKENPPHTNIKPTCRHWRVVRRFYEHQNNNVVKLMVLFNESACFAYRVFESRDSIHFLPQYPKSMFFYRSNSNTLACQK